MCGLDTIFLFNKMEGYIQLFTTSSDLVFQTSHKKIDIMINESYTHCLIINDCPSHNMFSRIPNPEFIVFKKFLYIVLWRKKETKLNVIGSKFCKMSELDIGNSWNYVMSGSDITETLKTAFEVIIVQNILPTNRKSW